MGHRDDFKLGDVHLADAVVDERSVKSKKKRRKVLPIDEP